MTPQASAVALAAYRWSRLQDAATAFDRARQSADSEIAALAGCNLGAVYRELGRSDDELAAYQRVIDDYGQDPAPALREQVATALGNKGVRSGVLGRSDDEEAADQRVIDDTASKSPPPCASRSPRRWATKASGWGCWATRTTS